MHKTLVVRQLGCVAYEPTWHAMQNFTQTRDAANADEIWLLEHPQIYTQGQAGKAEHILAAGDIPVVQVDRGGQVTYHGPGQLIAYVLVDVRRRGQGVRDLVNSIENSLIDVLGRYSVTAQARADAPGVYVANKKIASLGLRIRRGCSFHGLALNVAMDLQPFQRINPCGYAGLQMTQLCDETQQTVKMSDVSNLLCDALVSHLKYDNYVTLTDGIECYE